VDRLVDTGICWRNCPGKVLAEIRLDKTEGAGNPFKELNYCMAG